MRKLVRRTVTIVITETWTIVWIDAANTDAGDNETQSEVAEQVNLTEQPLFGDPSVDTEREVPPDELVPSLSDDVPDITVSGDTKQSPSRGKEGGDIGEIIHSRGRG